MPRLSFKPDSSFFRKIAIGAVGTQAISKDLAQHGHVVHELERGSLDTKIWKEVKRKRVRIPDLVCSRCGLRIESRAKTDAKLSMSHSDEEERAWSYGMVDSDLIAFPVCQPKDETSWSTGRLQQGVSYWHERNWVRWEAKPFINYIGTGEFRVVPFRKEQPKGVTEGSEMTISWPALFATTNGVVESIQGDRIMVKPPTGSRRSLKIRDGARAVVAEGQQVQVNQLLAAAVQPSTDLKCAASISTAHLLSLLESRERTQRFTGVKLCRLNQCATVSDLIKNLEADTEEDVYIRLEAAAYLVRFANQEPERVFAPYLESADDQRRLEAVIALGEAKSAGAVSVLSRILQDASQPYFMRSAAAWCLGQAGDAESAAQLVRTFRDVDEKIRDEALEGIAMIGADATTVLMAGLGDLDSSIAAGRAEALRRRALPEGTIEEAVQLLRRPEPSPWAVWLLGNLPRHHAGPYIAQLQDQAPGLHFALTLLWSFTESWVARRWELSPGAEYPRG
ncbi:MAG: HEAT repeat domain-containing protein [Acidobacteria bacterium]|nr:HEAT repeat domain-containing protein [Acidobacteriota bacterium]